MDYPMQNGYNETATVSPLKSVPANIEAERTAVLRRLISAAGKIAELAYDESQDMNEVVDRAEQIIFGISESRIHRDLTPIRAIISDVVERIDFLTRNRDTLMGVPTGFTL